MLNYSSVQLVTINLVITGQDTTANTLMFALILLTQHPNVMER